MRSGAALSLLLLVACAADLAAADSGGSRLPAALLRPSIPPSFTSQQADGDFRSSSSSATSPPADFLVRDSRVGFIRKVYSILCVQLLVTGLVGWATMGHKGKLLGIVARNPKGTLWAILAPAFVGEIVPIIALSNEKIRRKFPLNMLFLAIQTAGHSLMVSLYTLMMPARVILVALLQTSVALLGLTMYAFQHNPKYDLTAFGSALGSLFSILLCFGLVLLFGGGRHPVAHAAYSALIAGAVSLSIIYDTQLVIGGKHRTAGNQLNAKDYALGACILYTDMIHLFLRIVELMARVMGDQD